MQQMKKQTSFSGQNNIKRGKGYYDIIILMKKSVDADLLAS